MRRVQIALGLSSMDMAHKLDMSIGDYLKLSNLPRVELVSNDPMWLDITELLDKRIGACTAMQSEVRVFISGRWRRGG